MPATSVPAELSHCPFRGGAAVRGGLVTWRQLTGPRYRRLFPDVYVPAGLALDHHARCQAAALLLPLGSGVSHQSAAYLHGVELLPLGGAPVEVTVPRGRALRSPPGLVVRRAAVPQADLCRRSGLPVTTPLRTAFDLARGPCLESAVAAIDALLYRRLVTVPGLRSFLAGHEGWPGVRRVPGVLDLVATDVESPMETRLRLLLLQAGLPRPTVQHDVCDADGHFVARLDLAYPKVFVGLEYDGDHHRDRTVFQRDVARLNRLRLCSWTVLRFTADDVLRHRERVVAQVHAVLAQP